MALRANSFSREVFVGAVNREMFVVAHMVTSGYDYCYLNSTIRFIADRLRLSIIF
jgi:hypothetical protein